MVIVRIVSNVASVDLIATLTSLFAIDEWNWQFEFSQVQELTPELRGCRQTSKEVSPIIEGVDDWRHPLDG